MKNTCLVFLTIFCLILKISKKDLYEFYNDEQFYGLQL